MIILLFKLLATPALILIATLVSRRFGQATGGWLVGLPLTSGPIAVFLAIEHGPRFSQLAAAGSLEGTVGQAFFATAYAGLARRWNWPMCLLGATIAFLASGVFLVELKLPISALVALACGSLAVGQQLIHERVAPAVRAEAPRWDLPVRMAVAAALVLLVTSVAAAIGPDLSGVAATFPLFAIVLAVFAHRHQGSHAARSVMRGLLLGLFGFVGFFVAVSLLVTRIGLVSAFGTAHLVNLVIHGDAYLILRRRLL